MKKLFLALVLLFSVHFVQAYMQNCNCSYEQTIYNWQSPYPYGVVVSYQWTYVVNSNVGCSQGLSTMNMYGFGDVSIYVGGVFYDFEIFLDGIQNAINCSRGTMG